MVAAHELGGVNEHAARAAGRIENLAVVGLDHLDDQLHDGRGSEILTALLHEGRGELAHEILEDQAVGVASDLQRGQQAHQLAQHAIGQGAVALRHDPRQIGVILGDPLHRDIQGVR